MISRLGNGNSTSKYFFVYDESDNGVCVGFGKSINEVANFLGCKRQDVRNMVYKHTKYQNRYSCEVITEGEDF